MITEVVFPQDLVLRRKRVSMDGALFYVNEEYSVEYTYMDERWRYTVPKGYATDLASVPRGFRNIASKVDGVEASVIHDHAYETQSLPRAVADELFLCLMKESKISWVKRNIMWSAVRVGGWAIYNQKDRLPLTEGYGPVKIYPPHISTGATS